MNPCRFRMATPLACALLLPAMPADAQDAPAAVTNQADMPPSADEITVTGWRLRRLDEAAPTASRLGLSVRQTPATIDQITSGEMLTRGFRTVEEATVSLPGIISGGSPGDPSLFSMRGFTGEQVTILHNGLYLGPANMITGDVVQRTTRWQRGWNWPGAVLHWAYLTPLRSSFTAWDRTVWTASLVALLAAMAGMVLGVQRTLAVRRAGVRRLTWFRARWPRWHHLGGLFVGVFVLSWMLSGWLSMDHGRLFSRGRPTPGQAQAYAGLALHDAAAAFPLGDLARLPPAREIRFQALAGTPLLAVDGDRGQTRAYALHVAPASRAELDALVVQAVARAWPAASLPPRPGRVAPDDLYLLAEGLPRSTLRVAGTAKRPPVYVDGDDGRLLTVMDGSRAAYAWVYYGLHSFNFPGLARHPWLRYGVVLVLMLAGFLFSLTGVVLGWKRLRRATQ